MSKQKDKQRKPARMNLVGERGESNRLYVEGVPVWYSQNGQVNPDWLSACEEERNLTGNLMGQIADPLNLQKAYRRVVQNGGSAGVDGMMAGELQAWLSNNLAHLQQQLLEVSYQPQAVRGVQIPKPQGGYRQLGIPTVKDRMIQQAIQQVLSVRYERIFSENSYGFRQNKNAHQALKQAGAYVEIEIKAQRSYTAQPRHKPGRNDSEAANNKTGMASIFSLRNNEEENGNHRGMDKTAAEML